MTVYNPSDESMKSTPRQAPAEQVVSAQDEMMPGQAPAEQVVSEQDVTMTPVRAQSEGATAGVSKAGGAEAREQNVCGGGGHVINESVDAVR